MELDIFSTLSSRLMPEMLDPCSIMLFSSMAELGFVGNCREHTNYIDVCRKLTIGLFPITHRTALTNAHPLRYTTAMEEVFTSRKRSIL
jgi:hypothetical protein